MAEQLTPERIQKHYNACLDSVYIINDAIANPSKYTQDGGTIERNLEHLKLMRSQTFWVDEDMTLVDAAIVAGEEALSGV